jgi:hypothetical protein
MSTYWPMRLCKWQANINLKFNAKAELLTQVMNVRVSAYHLHNVVGMEMEAAWVVAIKRAKKNRVVSALMFLLIRVLAFGFSTSGVERTLCTYLSTTCCRCV